MAASAAGLGPMGFSLALMTTEPGGKAWKTRLRGTSLVAATGVACCRAAQARWLSESRGTEAARPAKQRKERREVWGFICGCPFGGGMDARERLLAAFCGPETLLCSQCIAGCGFYGDASEGF